MRNFYLIILCASLTATAMYSMEQSKQFSNLLNMYYTTTKAEYDGKNWKRKVIDTGFGTKPRQVELRRSGWLYDEVVTLRSGPILHTIEPEKYNELTGLSKKGVISALLAGIVYFYLQDNEATE